jgi:hypothetical protein
MLLPLVEARDSEGAPALIPVLLTILVQPSRGSLDSFFKRDDSFLKN